MSFKCAATVVTIIDIFLAAVLMVNYVLILEDNVQELQLEKRSRGDHAILYVYVSISVVVQLIFAFSLYKSIAYPSDEEDRALARQLRKTKYYTIGSYLILINSLFKTGAYAKRCNCILSTTLGIFIFAIAFRICAIGIATKFSSELEKKYDELIRRYKLRSMTMTP